MNNIPVLILVSAFTGLAFAQGLQHLEGATEERCPYQVLFLDKDYETHQRPKVCSGILVSTEWVMTTSSCFDTSIGYSVWSKYDIIIGTSKWCEVKGTEFDLKYDEGYQIRAPLWSYKQMDNKNAAVHLVMVQLKPVNLTETIQLAKLATELPMDGDEFEATGWVKIQPTNSLSCNLMKATVPKVSDEQCRKAYISEQTYGTEFCAGLDKAGMLSEYPRDAGSPLVKNGLVYGLLARPKSLGSPSSPALYLSFKAYMDWIKLFISGQITLFSKSGGYVCSKN